MKRIKIGHSSNDQIGFRYTRILKVKNQNVLSSYFDIACYFFCVFYKVVPISRRAKAWDVVSPSLSSDLRLAKLILR